MLTELWNSLIFNPLLNTLVFIYKLVGSYGVAIIIFTILIKLITLPFTIQQQKAFKAQAAMAPELQALQKKYAKDPEKLRQEQARLYKESGVNPAGCLINMLIPWPFFLALYQSVSQVMSTQPEQFIELAKHLMPALATVIPVGEKFLWLNLARPDPYYILPMLAFLSAWAQQKMMTTPPTDPQQAQMNKTMGLMMPIFTAWITLSFASGLGVYWVLFNVLAIVQQYLVMHFMPEPAKATISLTESRPTPVTISASEERPSLGEAFRRLLGAPQPVEETAPAPPPKTASATPPKKPSRSKKKKKR